MRGEEGGDLLEGCEAPAEEVSMSGESCGADKGDEALSDRRSIVFPSEFSSGAARGLGEGLASGFTARNDIVTKASDVLVPDKDDRERGEKGISFTNKLIDVAEEVEWEVKLGEKREEEIFEGKARGIYAQEACLLTMPKRVRTKD